MRRNLPALSACLFLLCVLLTLGQANAQEATKSTALPEALKKVTNAFGTQFVFDPDILQGKTTAYNLNDLKTKNLEDVLKGVLYPNNLVFLYVKTNYYTIVPKERIGNMPAPKNEENTSIEVTNKLSQIPARTITGVIVSETGQPVEGATVTAQKSGAATQSDAGGKFGITAEKGDVLSISSIGFQTQEVRISEQITVRVILQAVSKQMEDVVVVGYGTRKRSDVTGSITSINEQSIKDVPAANLAYALQGKGAGIDIRKNGGDSKPGATPTILIRGSRSLSASNSPLIVVDGIPFNGSINDINQDDVSSVDILKDASSTAIYGSRGANGVILITTKKGKTGKPVLSYSTYVGQTDVAREFSLFNADEFTVFKKWANINANPGKYTGLDDPQFYTNGVFAPAEVEGVKTGRNTDWQNLIYKKGIMTDHQLGITGGADKTQYALSAGYFKQTGIYAGQSFERFTAKASVDQQVNKVIKIGLSSLNTYSIRKGENASNMSYALRASPLAAPYDSAGRLLNDYIPGSSNQVWNPLADILPGAAVEDRTRFGTFTTLYADVNIAEGLKYRLNAGAEINSETYGNFYATKTNYRRGAANSSSNRTSFNVSYTLENILTYDKTFGEHKLNFTGLYSIQDSKIRTNQFDNTNIAFDALAYYNPTYGSNLTGSGTDPKWSIISYMGRLNYVFSNRYLLTATMRSDGSSRLAPGNKYHVFPSAAVAWNITNESFMKIPVLNNLKLRASYGTVGNTAINPYQTLGSLSSVTYNYGQTVVTGAYLTNAGNNKLTWEYTSTANIGLDFGLLKNRISGSAEVYKQFTNNLLLGQSLPITSGIPNATVRNIGKTENTGIELQLSTVNIQGRDRNGFSWTSDLNFFINRGKITQLANGVTRDIGNGWFVGKPVGSYYDYKRLGIWQNTPADSAAAKGYALSLTGVTSVIGTIKVADLNGANGKPDGKIDDTYDRIIIGSNQPKWEGGMTNRFGFKGFDLTVVAFARIGGIISSAIEGGNGISTYAGTYNNVKVNYWTPFNNENRFPKPNTNPTGTGSLPNYLSTLGYFDGSFVKIRTISLGYNLSPSIAQKIGGRSIRVYATSTDPFMLFAPYRKAGGLDPESAGTIGIDTPPLRSFLLGLNVSF